MQKKRHNRKYDGKKLGWLKDGKKFFLMILAAIVLFRILLGISFVDGDSMHPTLKNGTPVLYFRLAGSFDTGDIVSVRMPGGAYYIKRVVAVAGDTVELRDGKLYVNGAPSSINAYGATEGQSELVEYPLTVQDGHIFVMGDNREVSIDSRTFGEISVTQVRGKIIIPNR